MRGTGTEWVGQKMCVGGPRNGRGETGTVGEGRELCEWDRNCIGETGTIREGLKL